MATTKGPSLFLRITEALNVGVWRLPLPRRIQAVLSAIVYRNAPMSEADVANAMSSLEAAEVRSYCTGGWGVDALVGTETRKHRDLDLLVEADHMAAAEAALESIGYREWYRVDSDQAMHSRLVVRDTGHRVIDLHPAPLDEVDLQFASGTIGGVRVGCLSAGVQADQHDGYRKRRRDRLDVRVLRRIMLGSVTALVIPVADIDPLIDRNARDRGMPPHVSVLFPFLNGRSIDRAAESDLARIIGERPAFDFTLDRIDRFPGVVHLPPTPNEPFVQLSDALVRRWPDHEPYGGAYDEFIPHLTVAYGESAPPGLEKHLPIKGRAEEVWLMSRQGRRWVCRTRFPLGKGEEPDPPARA